MIASDPIAATLAGLESLGVEAIDGASDAPEGVNDLKPSAEMQMTPQRECVHPHRARSLSWPGDGRHRQRSRVGSVCVVRA